MLQRRFPVGFLVMVPLVTGALFTGCKNNNLPPPVTDPSDTVQSLSLKRVNPKSGPNHQRTEITIDGTGFEQGAKVFIGDTPAEKAAVVSGTEIKASVPKGLAPNAYMVSVRNPDGTEATLPGGFRVLQGEDPFADTCTLKTVYFEFDDSGLTESSRASLQESVQCLQAKKVDRVRAEGHADERGSTDYNLALGQRRAESVRSYMANLGWPTSQVTPVSYGEERPTNRGHSESAWGENRRVELVIAP